MRWYYWLLFAFIMGFTLEGNVVAASVQPIEQTHQAQPNQSTNEIAIGMSADDRIADYTWTLDILTGVLAVATVGLLIATAWGIFKQSREAKILQRAYLSVEPEGIFSLRGDPTNNKLVSHLSINNAGRLPATEVSGRCVTFNSRVSP